LSIGAFLAAYGYDTKFDVLCYHSISMELWLRGVIRFVCITDNERKQLCMSYWHKHLIDNVVVLGLQSRVILLETLQPVRVTEAK